MSKRSDNETHVRKLYKTTRRVEFRDTDAAGIMHFSTFFTYMEQVEHEFLREIGLSVLTKDAEGAISWPRVSLLPANIEEPRFEDVLDVEMQLLRRGEKSVTYGFLFKQGDRLVAEGRVTAVCCRLHPTNAPLSIAIPDWIIERFELRTKSKSRRR